MTENTVYRDTLLFVMKNGERISHTPQDVGALTCFGTIPPLVYDVREGFPVITERTMGWRAPIGEMCAFINGVQNFTVMRTEFGVPAPFWEPWVTERKCAKAHAQPNCLGDASYGPAIAAFPTPDGDTYDQLGNVLRMLADKKLQNRRTLYVSPWIPYMNGWGANQRAVVSPCHGWMHFRVINGHLDLLSWHRAADLPLGFPNDMISYSALLLMMSHISGIPARRLVFQIGDGHIYTNQVDAVNEMLSREPQSLPLLRCDPTVSSLRDFRSSHFSLAGYTPHPKMLIPSAV